MNEKPAIEGASALDSSLAAEGARSTNQSNGAKPGFIRRYRLPLFLAVVAVCLYAGSILYILLGRGQLA